MKIEIIFSTIVTPSTPSDIVRLKQNTFFKILKSKKLKSEQVVINKSVKIVIFASRWEIKETFTTCAEKHLFPIVHTTFFEMND